MDSEKLKGHLLIGTANVLFGISIPIFKYLLSSGVPPEAVTIMRSIFACLMFWGVSFFIPKEKVLIKDFFVIGLKCTSTAVPLLDNIYNIRQFNLFFVRMDYLCIIYLMFNRKKKNLFPTPYCWF